MEEWKLGNETDDANMVIDQKLRQYFDGRIVRKDLTKSIKRGQMSPSMYWSFSLANTAVRMMMRSLRKAFRM